MTHPKSICSWPYRRTARTSGISKPWPRDDAKALEYYERALELDPDYAPAELGKLEILRFMGNFPPFFLTLDHFIRNGLVRDDIKSQYLGSLIDHMDSRFYWVWGEQLGKLVDVCYRQAPDDPGSNLLKLRMCIIENKQDSILYMCGRLAEVAAKAGDKENQVLALLATPGRPTAAMTPPWKSIPTAPLCSTTTPTTSPRRAGPCARR